MMTTQNTANGNTITTKNVEMWGLNDLSLGINVTREHDALGRLVHEYWTVDYGRYEDLEVVCASKVIAMFRAKKIWADRRNWA